MALKRTIPLLLIIMSGLSVGTTFGLHPCTDDWFCACSSPIIVDVGGNEIQLTDAVNGVSFDIRGNGQSLYLGWTAPGAQNAWLALDRNGNGTIDSGKELFGNFTTQPDCEDPNGFIALAEFDKTANGGNEDGVIDNKDSVYSALRLWIDKNHNGVSEPDELFTLSALGVTSLSLDYQESARRDRYGNRLRYRARVNVGSSSQSDVGKFAWDVYLTTQVPTPPGTPIVGTISGSEFPSQIPNDVVYEMFLRIASCSDSDPELHKKKCFMVQTAVGLAPEDAQILPVHLKGLREQFIGIDDQTRLLRYSTAPDRITQFNLLASRRRALALGKINELRQKLTPEGRLRFDAISRV